MSPKTTIIYVASLGNGCSSGLTPKEMAYYATTGRMTHTENGRLEALPTVQNLVGAVANDYDIRKLAGNSAGTIQVLASGLALPKNHIERAALNTETRFTSTTPPQLAYRALVRAISENNRIMALPHDELAVNDDAIKQVGQIRSGDIYAPRPKSFGDFAGWAGMLLTNMSGLSHGLHALEGDLRAYLTQQPDSVVTFIVPEEDSLHGPQLLANARTLVNSVDGNIRILQVPEATHTYNTPNPRAFYALMDHALGVVH